MKNSCFTCLRELQKIGSQVWEILIMEGRRTRPKAKFSEAPQTYLSEEHARFTIWDFRVPQGTG